MKRTDMLLGMMADQSVWYGSRAAEALACTDIQAWSAFAELRRLDCVRAVSRGRYKITDAGVGRASRLAAGAPVKTRRMYKSVESLSHLSKEGREELLVRMDAATRAAESGCIEWQRATANGYGRIHAGVGQLSSHRVAYMLAHGDIPSGHQVLHRCDNPPCVNPDHLFTGSNMENVADMVAKGRNRRGEAAAISKLSEDQVRAIRRDGRPQDQIASAFGISQANVSLVKNRKSWAHVHDETPSLIPEKESAHAQ
jgi:hypothetical protein